VAVERKSVREGYDLWAPIYDEMENPVVEADARLAIPLLAPKHGERILDAGCGTGRNLVPILGAGAVPVGLDFSLGMLAVARRGCPSVPLIEADLQAPLPFRAGCFDAVLCALIGEHLPELAGTLAEFHRVLRPGGRLAFTVYHPDLAHAGVEANFEIGGTEYRLGAVLYKVEDYLRLISATGFTSVTHTESRDPARAHNLLLAIAGVRA